MTTMPPLTPAECDLQDFPFMPLHVARLRDSDLAAEAAPEACWYAVLLWAASWHQLPAASLPNNDAVLTKLIGLGRDERTFRKHKDAAMRGFVLCSDGRLYHPVVAEQALAAWDSKLQQRWRTECARIKKANQRNGTNDPTPTFDDFIAGRSPPPSDPSPESVPEDRPPCPEGQRLQETGTGTGTSKKEAIASSSSGDDARPPMGRPKARVVRDYPAEFEAAWRAYPHTVGRSSKPNTLAEWRKLPADEQASLRDAVERFAPHVDRVCGGKGAPDFAVWLKNGKHLNWQTSGDLAGSDRPRFPGPPKLREWIVAHQDEVFAATYLDTSTWDQEQRIIYARNKLCAAKLRDECAPVLDRAKATVALALASGRPATAETSQPMGAAA